MSPSSVWIGTAGWSVPSRYAGEIPPGGSHLERYARRVNVACGALLDRFAAEVVGLGDKLGVLLVQLPPKFVFDERVADRFVRDLRRRIDTPVAFEPRHPSWFTSDVDDWLAKRRLARVAADPASVAGAEKPGGWSRLAYYRWHGSPRIYFSEYDAAALASLKQRRPGSGGRRCDMVHLRQHRVGSGAWACARTDTANGKIARWP